jgi:hypothetical protein
MSLPQLYTPSADEINTVTASAKRRHPDLAARLDKAAELLHSGNVQLDPTPWERSQLARWVVPSQSGRGAYVVNRLDCPCRDLDAPHVGRARCCKHSMAVALLTKILTNRLNADIRAFNVELGILPNGEFQAYAHNRRMGCVQIRKMGARAYCFADAASMVHYSIHLAARQPVAVQWPTAAQVAA